MCDHEGSPILGNFSRNMWEHDYNLRPIEPRFFLRCFETNTGQDGSRRSDTPWEPTNRTHKIESHHCKMLSNSVQHLGVSEHRDLSLIQGQIIIFGISEPCMAIIFWVRTNFQTQPSFILVCIPSYLWAKPPQPDLTFCGQKTSWCFLLWGNDPKYPKLWTNVIIPFPHSLRGRHQNPPLAFVRLLHPGRARQDRRAAQRGSWRTGEGFWTASLWHEKFVGKF